MPCCHRLSRVAGKNCLTDSARLRRHLRTPRSCQVEMQDEPQESDLSAFGALLRRYRFAAGLSQEALAERAGVSSYGISALERGYRRTPQRETLGRLAVALALSVEERRAFEAAATRLRSPRSRTETSLAADPWHNAGSASFPLALTRFVGRSVELDEIAAMLRDHRMVTLTGAGGIGKTQAALRAATALSEAGGTAVYFIGLASIAVPSFVVTALASALGVQEVQNRSLLQTLVAHLKDRAVLLILDNCEHVIEESAIVAQALLADCPGVRILATSREPLLAAGERAYRLPSLADDDAIALFADRARAVDSRFTLTDENPPIVGEICRRLDGIPLAIELAAARVNSLAVREILKNMNDRFAILTAGERTALPRQRTMRATIDWSYNLLSAQEQCLFNRLSVFAGGFSLAAAATVCSDDRLSRTSVLNLLSALVDKSLVIAEPRGDALRYRLLESTGAYASEKLGHARERDLFARRHLRYLRQHFAELWERTARRSVIVAALEEDLENVRAALDEGLGRSEPIDGAELLNSIDVNWRALGLEAEGTARCEAYFEALPSSESRLRAGLSVTLSLLVGVFGNKMLALELATRAVELARASGDAPSLASALRQRAATALLLYRLDDAEDALCEAEAIPGSAMLRTSLLDTRAALSFFRGDIETGLRLFEQVREEHHSLGNFSAEQTTAVNIAEIEHARGQTQRAVTVVRETLAATPSGPDEYLLLHNLAGYLAAMDDLSGAAAAAGESIRVRAAQVAEDVHVAIAIEHAALVFALRGDLVRAASLEGYADATIHRSGFHREFTETTTYDRLAALLAAGLAIDELARVTAQGAALAPEAAIALALESL